MEQKKILSVAIIGFGGRGYAYGAYMHEHAERFHLTAICDIDPKQLDKARTILKLPEESLFDTEERFFEEKRADLIYIATYDWEHVRQAVCAMRLGYDVLLEKPISDSVEELNELSAVQEETGRRVFVCHELRYGVMYEKLYELLQSGVIGKLMAIDHFERVGYWHMAQAYVRIQSEARAYATILAKCSHDLDLIVHFAGSECLTVSSIGGLGLFRRENAPLGATARCLDCPHVDTCTYSAKRIYIDMWHENGCPEYVWPYNKVSLRKPTDEASLYEGLRTKCFGKCAFLCGVEADEHVADHQLVQMQFADGVTASLKMVFGAVSGRRINLFGSEGELLMDERRGFIEVMPYGKPKQTVTFESLADRQGHGGGDSRLIEDMYAVLTGARSEGRTPLCESIECHKIGIAAERSRLDGGKTVAVHE